MSGLSCGGERLCVEGACTSAAAVDDCPGDPEKVAPGQCGCDINDADRDGDGTPDCHDACPEDANYVALPCRDVVADTSDGDTSGRVVTHGTGTTGPRTTSDETGSGSVTTSAGATATGTGATEMAEGDGCSCHVQASGRPWALVLAGLGLVGFTRRRRRSHRSMSFMDRETS